MTTTGARELPRPSLRARLTPPLPPDRLAGWLWPLAVAALAGLLRFVRLGHPSGVIFDEKYYAQDALSLLHHGVERTADGPSFVVHPPLGKWLIAVGEWIFGTTPDQVIPLADGGAVGGEVGFRLAAAVGGTLSVLILARVARRMTRSTLLGTLAGLLLALDGLHFVQSRVAMLDIFVMFWVLAAFACLVIDRDVGRRRLADLGTADARVGVRWWRVAAGVCLGAAVATKWSGLFYVAGFGLLTLAWDVGARRALGAWRPLRATLRRDTLGLVLPLLVVPAVVYLVAWTGWFVTDGGYARHWASQPGNTDTFWFFLPDAWRSWWHYHAEIWHFHTTLTADHPYASRPWGWLLLARPVSYFYATTHAGDPGCHADTCSSEVLAIGSPAIWWAAIPALIAMLWVWATRRDWRAAAVLVGVAASTLVWVPSALDGRTEFLFYALPALPFLVLALTLCAGLVLGGGEVSARRRRWGAIAVGGYVLVVIVVFFGLPFVPEVGLYPILSGEIIPYVDWHAKMWFPSWI